MKIRRNPSLVCLWTPSGIEVAPPDTPVRHRLAPPVVSLLSELDGWVEQDEIIEKIDSADKDRVRAWIKALEEAGIIQSQGAAENAGEDGPWDYWGTVARYFHTVTRDARYPETADGRLALARSIANESTAPPIFKSYPDKPRVLLPRAFRQLDMPIAEVFKKRRTHRNFTADPVDCDTLATILHYAFAPQRFVDAELFGVQQMRVSPSAGSRHEVECYVVPLNIAGIDPGLYHYDAQTHALELLRGDFGPAEIAAVTYGQEAFAGAAFVCFTTVVARRLAWKYRHPRAYRLWMYDAGHYGQTFVLTCTATGLGAFQTAAFLDSALEEALGVDPEQEFGAYAFAAGHPRLSSSGVPIFFHYPSPGSIA